MSNEAHQALSEKHHAETREMRRVVTRFGIGKVINEEESHKTVYLDGSCLDPHEKRLRNDEIFFVSDWATVRIIGKKHASLQFHESQEEMLTTPVLRGQVICFLDLISGRFKVNPTIKKVTRYPVIIMGAWLNQPGMASIREFNLISDSRNEFNKDRKDIAGTTEGVQFMINLIGNGKNGNTGNILGFCIINPYPDGVVFQKEFDPKPT